MLFLLTVIICLRFLVVQSAGQEKRKGEGSLHNKWHGTSAHDSSHSDSDSDEEEEETEDEIFSHKAVVTKFLNKVKVLLFERKIMSSRSDLNFLFSAILSVRVANCIWQVLFSSVLC